MGPRALGTAAPVPLVRTFLLENKPFVPTFWDATLMPPIFGRGSYDTPESGRPETAETGKSGYFSVLSPSI